MDIKEIIKTYIEKNEREIIDFQTLLTSYPAISPDSGGDGESGKAEALSDKLKSFGFKDIEFFNAPDSRVSSGVRPNMVATIPGKKPDRIFWIMTHLDVVPPGELSLWNTDPFKVEYKGGKLFGRGVEDNQQGLTASVFAALSLMENNIVPEYTVKLLFVADEEVGSDYGITYLLKNCSLFSKNDYVLVPDSGDPEGKTIEIAEKSIAWLKFTTKGKQCHASRPDLGKNAFTAASDMVIRLSKIEGILNDNDPIFDPPFSTITPTRKEANVPNVNTLPGEDIFYIDCRILPSTGLKKIYPEIDRIVSEIEKEYGVKVKYEHVQKTESESTSANCILVKKLEEKVKDVYRTEPQLVGIGGGTVAAYLRNEGIDAVVWGRIDETAHMPNEYCKMENLKGDALIMALIMAGL